MEVGKGPNWGQRKKKSLIITGLIRQLDCIGTNKEVFKYLYLKMFLIFRLGYIFVLYTKNKIWNLTQLPVWL
jgi:hypothetical protein